MAEVAADLTAEQQRLAEALKANPRDSASHVKMAQTLARQWAESPQTTDVALILDHLDRALEGLDAAHHAPIAGFVNQLRQRGAPIDSLASNGRFPRLGALLGTKPNPTQADATDRSGPSPKPASPAAPPPAQAGKAEPSSAEPPTRSAKEVDRSAPETPKASEKPSSASPPPSGALIELLKDKFKNSQVDEISTVQIKQLREQGDVIGLAKAFQLIDNFRIRRVIIDTVAEVSSIEALAALIHILSFEHEDKIIAYILRKVGLCDPKLLEKELCYDVKLTRYKLALVTVMGAFKNPNHINHLAAALRDPESAVRIKAIECLSSIYRTRPEWLQKLTRILQRDVDPEVKRAVAATLRKMDTFEAFQALDLAAKQSDLDSAVRTIHEAMSHKFLTERADRAGDANSEEDDSKKSGKQIVIAVVVLVVAVGGYFAFKMFSK